MQFLQFWTNKKKSDDIALTSTPPAADTRTDAALLDAVAGAIALQRLASPLDALGTRVNATTEDGLRQVAAIGKYTAAVADRADTMNSHALRQAFAHCAIFPTAASRRSLDRVSVPVWLIILSDQLLIVALVGHYPTN